MTDADELLSEADALLEQNRFSEAKLAYRAVLESGVASSRAIINLEVAEGEDRLAFLRSLVARYPEEMEYRIAQVNELILAGRADHAIQFCTLMLGKTTELREQLLIRLLRLRAAAQSWRCESYVEDFREVWNAGETVPGFDRMRRTLIESISGCTRVEAIPSFQALAEGRIVSEALVQFIQAKVTELRALEECMKSEVPGMS